MFRKMRRHHQELGMHECRKMLENGSSGVLALAGDNGYPYAVPISYVLSENKIYFHSAKSGHKIDAVMREEKASFCVIDRDDVVPEKYTTSYKSVIVFGKMRLIENAAEKRSAIEALAKKYTPDNSRDSINAEINKDWDALCMIELTIEHISGKQAKHLVSK